MDVQDAISLTEKIIGVVHRRYVEEKQEDSDYLECLSLIVSAVTEWIQGQGEPATQVAYVADSLEFYARDLFIDHWLESAESSDPPESVQADAEDTFNCLFTNYEAFGEE